MEVAGMPSMVCSFWACQLCFAWPFAILNPGQCDLQSVLHTLWVCKRPCRRALIRHSSTLQTQAPQSNVCNCCGHCLAVSSMESFSLHPKWVFSIKTPVNGHVRATVVPKSLSVAPEAAWTSLGSGNVQVGARWVYIASCFIFWEVRQRDRWPIKA